MSSGPEIRRRQQQTSELSSSPRKGDRPKVGPFIGARAPVSFLVRNLPWILGLQVLFLVLIISDPLGLRRQRGAAGPTPPPEDERNKPLLSIGDVETITARVSVNETVLLLLCPNGYTDFLENWFLVTAQHTDLQGRFLILAEDEETFAKINGTYPRNAILRMDVKEPFPDVSACRSPNKLYVGGLQTAYRKAVYIRELMNAGQNVLLNDVTAVWAQNPFPHFVSSDVYLTLGDVAKTGGEQLLVDFPRNAIAQLQPPLPRGVGKLPPVSDEIMFLQNNVGAWVTLDYWAVVIEGLLWKECNSTNKHGKGSDMYTTGASTEALVGAINNAVHLSPRPHIGLMPPGSFPPPTVYVEDASWRTLIEKETVVVRTKLGTTSKDQMKARLEQLGLWRVGGTVAETVSGR